MDDLATRRASGRERAMARELQRVAVAAPLDRAPHGAHEDRFFRRIDRETTWGLTLNK